MGYLGAECWQDIHRPQEQQLSKCHEEDGFGFPNCFTEHNICVLMLLSGGGKLAPGLKGKGNNGWKTLLLRDRAFEIGAETALSPVGWTRGRT